MDSSRLFAIAVLVLQRVFPEIIWFDRSKTADVFLTYDDGPHVDRTRKLLDILRAGNVKATFFLLGERLAERGARDLVFEMHRQGHGLGIHGFSHRPFLFFSKEKLRRDLDVTRDIIYQAVAENCMSIHLVRPPGGLISPIQLRWILDFGFKVVMCSVLPQDWRRDLTSEQIAARVLRDATKPGSIIALHDGRPRAGSNVVEVTDLLLKAMRNIRSFGVLSNTASR